MAKVSGKRNDVQNTHEASEDARAVALRFLRDGYEVEAREVEARDGRLIEAIAELIDEGLLVTGTDRKGEYLDLAESAEAKFGSFDALKKAVVGRLKRAGAVYAARGTRTNRGRVGGQRAFWIEPTPRSIARDFVDTGLEGIPKEQHEHLVETIAEMIEDGLIVEGRNKKGCYLKATRRGAPQFNKVLREAYARAVASELEARRAHKRISREAYAALISMTEAIFGMQIDGLLVPGTAPDGGPAFDLTKKGIREFGPDAEAAVRKWARRHGIAMWGSREREPEGGRRDREPVRRSA